MSRRTPLVLIAALAAVLLLNGSGNLCAEQLSEGHPHKWEVVNNQSLYDFIAHGYELKSVAYESLMIRRCSARKAIRPMSITFYKGAMIW